MLRNCNNILSRLRSARNRPGTLSARCQGPARLLPFLLVISFICNVTALFAPFLDQYQGSTRFIRGRRGYRGLFNGLGDRKPCSP